MNIINKAEREFNILEKEVEDAIIMPFKTEILSLVKKFGNSGQSGASAPYTAGAISKAVKTLCLQEPICDIIGNDDEWVDCSDMGNSEIYQNRRLSSIFKVGKSGKPYYIDAIVFKGQNGNCFTGNNAKLKDGSSIGSRQFIRLPFKPKTFYVDVIETEWHKNTKTGKLTKQKGGGWWTSVVKDETQLDKVFNYYLKEKE